MIVMMMRIVEYRLVTLALDCLIPTHGPVSSGRSRGSQKKPGGGRHSHRSGARLRWKNHRTRAQSTGPKRERDSPRRDGLPGKRGPAGGCGLPAMHDLFHAFALLDAARSPL